MKLRNAFLLAAIALALPVIAFFVFSSHYAHHREQPADEILSLAFWQHMVMPGELSQAHASLENNCAACHTPIKGVQAQNCITCHANNESLLQRQPTAFHADVGSCVECHTEHRGINKRPNYMDHLALSKIGFRQLQVDRSTDGENDRVRKDLLNWIGQHQPVDHKGEGHSSLTPQEAVLNCATCHSKKDRHFKLFGQDCAQCHGTTKWTIAEFRHPSPNSMDCVQCHQAPPSHYMMHFQMISAKVAGKPDAQVNQCYKCHQTTAWNDIKGAGFFKHH